MKKLALLAMAITIASCMDVGAEVVADILPECS